MSPNVEEEQIHENEQVHDTLPDDRLLLEDESQSRVKEERKEEEVTPKSEPATAEVKEEQEDHDFEDSFRPEHVAEELQRLMADFPPVVDPIPQSESREGATAPDAFREMDGPYAPRRSRRYCGRTVSHDPLMFHTTIRMEHDHEASAQEEPIAQIDDKCPRFRLIWRH